MAESAHIASDPLKAVPFHAKHRILSGMRWTLWLSVIASPLGYGTSVLLARVGPEAMGTYGLLMVYIGLAAGVFYLGGDPVAIKFLPELATEDRISFLGSYFAIACLAVVPWFVIAASRPD